MNSAKLSMPRARAHGLRAARSTLEPWAVPGAVFRPLHPRRRRRRPGIRRTPRPLVGRHRRLRTKGEWGTTSASYSPTVTASLLDWSTSAVRDRRIRCGASTRPSPQVAAATGRLASSDPNSGNIPRVPTACASAAPSLRGEGFESSRASTIADRDAPDGLVWATRRLSRRSPGEDRTMASYGFWNPGCRGTVAHHK